MDKFTRSDFPNRTAFPIASAGYVFIIGAAFATAVLALLGLTTLTLIALVVTFCICGFFRDPDRIIPDEEGVAVSPADGKIILADTVDNSPFFSGQAFREWRGLRCSLLPGAHICFNDSSAGARTCQRGVIHPKFFCQPPGCR